ncbi:hypothetical protein ACQKLX_07395 [Bosea sp. NPDC003192]|uniref:hypothetical protein n=1 Tax=Bosea sp. NPDC003192 TaxID=3390551 RepID=UPI003CFFD26D
MTDDDHEFLVPAFSRIGRQIHGDQWRDDYPTLNPLAVKAQRVEEATPEERAWAHRVLCALFPDSYKEDFEEPPPPPQAVGLLGALGSGLPPQRYLGSAIESEGAPERPPGWWFSQSDWERFRAAVHYQNEMQKPKIAMVDTAARWLFNRIVRGEIVPFVQHARDGGGWSPTTADDWRMPSPERLRMRIQRCMMVPGRSAVPAGTHWIIINKAELSAAIEKEQNSVNGSAPPIQNAEVNVVDDAAIAPKEAATASAKGKELVALAALSALYPSGFNGVAERDRNDAVRGWLGSNRRGVTIGDRLISSAATRYRAGERA